MPLDYIRQRKTGVLSWLIVGGVVIVFIFWGIGSRQSAAARAATVNGDDLLVADVDREAFCLEKRYRQAFGRQIPEGLLSRADLRRQALDTLIVRTLLTQEAERLGFRATDEEVRQAITSARIFEVGGQFDRAQYEQVVANDEFCTGFTTPATFEAWMRGQVATEKLVRLAHDAAAASDAEARQAYAAEHDTVSLEVVRVPARPDPKATFPENALTAHYELHKSEYAKPATVTVAAVVVDPAVVGAKVSVSDEELEEAFEASKEEMATPPEVSARHILVAVPENAEPAAVETARAKAQAALDRLKKGEDFSKVALEVSDDRASLRDPKRAGDLGFFTRGKMVKPFDDAAFALKPGQLSDLVRSPFGFHVIRVNQVREGKTVTLADVRDRLLANLKTEKGLRRAGEIADNLAEAAAKSGDLAAEAKKADVPVRTVGPISAARPAADLGPTGRTSTEALRLQVNQVSLPIEDGRVWYVLQATARTEPSVPPLAEVMDRVKADLARQNASAAAHERATKLLEAARAAGNLAAAAKAAGLTVETTGPFDRRAVQIPKVGASRGVAEVAFRLAAVAPFPERPIAAGDDSLVIRLAGRQAADPSADPRRLAQVKQALRREKGDAAVRQLIEARRTAAKLWINPQVAPTAN
jgi:peptidyl-prolyl cis-trans isomerase D